MERLAAAISTGEDWLLDRVLAYALAQGYARYSSTLESVWRASITGASASLLRILRDEVVSLETSAPTVSSLETPLAEGAMPDVAALDAASAFAVAEARLHRQRGVSLGMYLGLFKYYRRAYLDLAADALSGQDRVQAAWFLERFFDRAEVAFVSEWGNIGRGERIDELQHANRLLTNEKNKYLTLFESLTWPVFLLNKAGEVEALNQAALPWLSPRIGTAGGMRSAVLEGSGADRLGERVAVLLPWLGDQPEAFLRDGEGAREVIRTAPGKGEDRQIRVLMARMEDASQKFAGAVLVLEDVTERERMAAELAKGRDRLEDMVRARTADLVHVNEALAQARAQAEKASRAKGEVLAVMSHEARTPLSGILGLTELLLRSWLSDDQRETVEQIREAGRSLLRLINDILDFSRIEAGKLDLKPEDFSPLELLERVTAANRERVEAKGLTLDLDHSGLPRRARGDRERLRQVLDNLLQNAIKFTDQGKIRLTVQAASDESGRARLACSVADTGRGIAAEKLGELFRSFSQLDPDPAKRQGVGLGLYICKRIVEAMDGRIWAVSEPGRGSVFFFTVGLGQIEEQAPDGPETAGGAPDAPRSLRVLLVEDSAINRRFLRTYLEDAGHRATCAVNGAEALELLAADRFDVALMDVQMPVMDGLEAVRRIRAGLPGVDPELPVVALTAYAIKGDRERFMALGMDEYVSKPVDLGELRAILDRAAQGVLRRGAARPSEPGASAGPGRPPAEGASDHGPAGADADLVAEAALRERYQGRWALFCELVELYRVQCEESVRDLREALAGRDAPGAAKAAHCLINAGAAVRSEVLVSAARNLEGQARQGDLSDAAAREAEIVRLAEAVGARLRRLAAERERFEERRGA